jgi:hypothetical protein
LLQLLVHRSLGCSGFKLRERAGLFGSRNVVIAENDDVEGTYSHVTFEPEKTVPKAKAIQDSKNELLDSKKQLLHDVSQEEPASVLTIMAKHFLVAVLIAGAHLPVRKQFFGSPASPASHFTRQRGHFHEVEDCGGQCFRIARRPQKPSFSIDDDFWHSTNSCRDDRQPSTHGFDDRDRNRFVDARKKEQVGSLQEGGHIVAHPEQPNIWRQSAGSDFSFDSPLLGAFAGQEKSCVRALSDHPLHCLDGGQVIFDRIQSGYVNDDEIGRRQTHCPPDGGSMAAIVREQGSVDPVVNDLDLIRRKPIVPRHGFTHCFSHGDQSIDLPYRQLVVENSPAARAAASIRAMLGVQHGQVRVNAPRCGGVKEGRIVMRVNDTDLLAPQEVRQSPCAIEVNSWPAMEQRYDMSFLAKLESKCSEIVETSKCEPVSVAQCSGQFGGECLGSAATVQVVQNVANRGRLRCTSARFSGRHAKSHDVAFRLVSALRTSS